MVLCALKDELLPKGIRQLESPVRERNLIHMQSPQQNPFSIYITLEGRIQEWYQPSINNVAIYRYNLRLTQNHKRHVCVSIILRIYHTQQNFHLTITLLQILAVICTHRQLPLTYNYALPPASMEYHPSFLQPLTVVAHKTAVVLFTRDLKQLTHKTFKITLR